MLPQPPRLVFTTGNAGRATDAFRLEAVDYLLKPLDQDQVAEAVNRLLAYLRPFESGSSPALRQPPRGSDNARQDEFYRYFLRAVAGQGCRPRPNSSARPLRDRSGAAQGSPHLGAYWAG